MGGLLGTHVVNYGFDYVLYPIVTYRFGFAKSLAVLFFAALVLNYTLVLIYDLLKVDLFGFEGVKELKDELSGTESKKNIFERIIGYLVKKGGIVAFVALSFYDPFIATLYKRRSNEFDGFKKRDYANLIMATAIGCFLWSVSWSVLIEPLKSLIHYLFA